MVQIAERKEFKAQPGPQELFLSSPADIVVYGGAAFGGKTFGLLMEGARHSDNPAFTATIFRRSMPQIMNQGALWDESFELYPHLGAESSVGSHSWTWPSGAEVRMAHLQEEKTIYDYDGAQIPLIMFDQLEQFNEKQFFYMLSRNRSGCGVDPYVRATANPPKVKGHWLRTLIDWWIDKDGFPIPERCGVVRYFIRVDNQVHWVESDWRDVDGTEPKSFTFIAAKYTDNQIGLKKDPKYVANLNAQDRTDRQRLKDGNWNAVEGGVMFDRDWFPIKHIRDIPRGMRKLRYWDRAGTLATAENPNPDWTAGALCGQKDGVLYIFDMVHFQENPVGNERLIRKTAKQDERQVPIYIEEEGGSAGKDSLSHYQRNVLRGYIVVGDRPTGSKTERAKSWCAMAAEGNVILVEGPWNQNFLAEAENFPSKGSKRDQIDAVSGAYKFLLGKGRGSMRDLVTE
jgi:predicted phage terminase large subunit-like protein